MPTAAALPEPDNLVGPEAEYTRRLDAQRDEAGRQLRRFRALALGRGLTIGVIIILALLSEKEQTVARIVLLVLPAMLVSALMVRRNRAARACRHALHAVDYYERRLACVAGEWAGHGDAGQTVGGGTLASRERSS